MTTKEDFESTYKLWRLAEIALQELRACNKAGIDINMGAWVRVDNDRVCSVCLAGAVMVNEYNVRRFVSSMIDSDLEGQRFRFFALDEIRCGRIADALVYLFELDSAGELDNSLIRLLDDAEKKIGEFDKKDPIVFIGNIVKLLKKMDI